MTKYGYFQALYKCFYSRDFYRDVVKNWQAGVILQLILLLLIGNVVYTMVCQKNINRVYSEFAQQLYPQLPDMMIINGRLTTPENKPYFIKNPNNKVVAIVDTSGKYTTLNDDTAEFLVTSNAVYYKSHNHVKAHVFTGLDLDLHRDRIQQLTETFVHWLWLILLPFFFMISFLVRLFQVAIYSLIGKIFSLLSSVTLTYGEVFKMTVFAITPVIFLNLIFDIFSISFHWEALLNFLIVMSYVVFGIYANKSTAEG